MSDRFRRQFATWTQLTPSGADVEEYADCYSFNQSATFIWLALDGRRSVSELVELVAEEFAVPAVRVDGDVRAFVRALLDARLIECVEAS